MSAGTLFGFLSLSTLLAVLVFVLLSNARVDCRRHHKTEPKSSLAKAGPRGGAHFNKK